MAQSKTIRVGDSFRVDVYADVSGVNVGTTRTVASSDDTVATKLPIDEHTWAIVGVAAGTCTITASCGGKTDTVALTVIADTAVTAVRIEIVDV